MEEIFDYLGVFGTPTLPFIVLGFISLFGLFMFEMFINKKPKHKWNSSYLRVALRFLMRVFAIAFLMVFLSFMGLQHISFVIFWGLAILALPMYIFKQLR